MKFEKILEINGIKFKQKKNFKNIPIYEINGNTNVVIMTRNDGSFDIERTLFNYLIEEKMAYSFLLINKKEKKIYYLDFASENNWLASSFNSCNKERLYFGKIVLNHQSNLQDFIKKLKSYNKF